MRDKIHLANQLGKTRLEEAGKPTIWRGIARKMANRECQQATNMQCRCYKSVEGRLTDVTIVVDCLFISLTRLFLVSCSCEGGGRGVNVYSHTLGQSTNGP